MIIVMNMEATKEDVEKVVSAIRSNHLQAHIVEEIGRASCRERV